MKLLIAIPTLDYIHFTFAECLSKLIKRLDYINVNFEVKFQGGTLVYHGRDDLGRYAINEGFTHCLWLDADMIFPETVFEDLLDDNVDFITAVYHARRPPYMSVIFSSLSPGVERFENYPIDVFEIAGCGFGCVLMKVEVLRQVCFANDSNMFLPTKSNGEDIAFCERWRKLGGKIYCDGGVRLGHISHAVIYPEDEERYKERWH